MAHLKVEDIKNLTEDELKEKLDALKKKLFSLRLQAKSGKLEKHAIICSTKRDIARVLTIMKENKS